MRKLKYSNSIGQRAAYKNYYCSQKGSGLDYFAGVQTGSGILSSLIKIATPLVKRGVKAVLPEAINLGKTLASDIILNKKSAKKALRRRGLESIQNLAGSVIKKRKTNSKDIFQ